MSVLVGKQAPQFTVEAVMPDNEIKNVSLSDYKGKYVVIFFYPLDFTFVCPSELIAFHNRIKDFEGLNTQVLSVSIDSAFSHLAWKNVPVEKGGVGQLAYPMLADVRHDIAKAYDVETEGGVALRGSFLIDKEGIVQHQVINNLPLGRNIDEMIRMVDSLQFTEKYGEVCPAGWSKGKDGMKATSGGVADFLSKHGSDL